MKNTIQKSILGNFRPDVDLLSFLPGLEAAADKNTKWVNGATVPKLGIAAFGWVAMAAVEQYAKDRKLNPGTAEVLRLSAFNSYISGSTVAAYHQGYIHALNALKQTRPDLDEWLNETFLLLDDKYQEAWRNSARAAAGVLKNIRDQNLRKGKRGNPGRLTFGLLASPETIILDMLDAEAMAAASNLVKFSERNNRDAIRSKIRTAVNDFIIRGAYHHDENLRSLKETIDVHTRRVQRKYDEFDADLVAKGLAPTNSKK